MVDNLGDDGEGTSIRSDGEVDNSTDLDESLETFVLRMVSLLNLITSLTPPSMVCHSFQIFLRGETVSRKRPKKDFFSQRDHSLRFESADDCQVDWSECLTSALLTLIFTGCGGRRMVLGSI